MRIYHLTQSESAERILSHGFFDTTNGEQRTGVWFAVPAVSNFTHGSGTVRMDTVVSLDFPDELLEQYERKYEEPPAWALDLPGVSGNFASARTGSREFCIPAAEVNKYRD